MDTCALGGRICRLVLGKESDKGREVQRPTLRSSEGKPSGCCSSAPSVPEIAAALSLNALTLRNWLFAAEVDADERDGVTTRVTVPSSRSTTSSPEPSLINRGMSDLVDGRRQPVRISQALFA